MRRTSRSRSSSGRPALQRILYPFQQFLQLETSSGVLLLICTAIALVWANSSYGDLYRQILDTPITVGVGKWLSRQSVLFWINDGLMAVFFFVVGLEIKREVIGGELADKKKAALPIIAAFGGMVAPACIYASLNWGTADIHGWGVPVATDIAFAIGVLTILGARAPIALKVFLTALAIADDIGAVVVIALFYGHGFVPAALALGLGVLALSWVLGRMGLRSPMAFALLGIGVWAAFLQSGVHATVAGVLLALTVPATTELDGDQFRARVEAAMDDFAQLPRDGVPTLAAEQQAAISALESACESVQTPLQRLERMLHPWVSYAIMPVFALANAGVHIAGIGKLEHIGVPLGVILGLVIGKPLGITTASWLAVRFRLAEKPSDVTWRQMLGAGVLGGIGFTMALFIAGLSYRHPATLAVAKASILIASLVAGVIGYALLRWCSIHCRKPTAH